MTEYYWTYMQTLAQRNDTLLIMLGFAIGLVAAWETLPKVMAGKMLIYVQRLYLVGGVVLYLLSFWAV